MQSPKSRVASTAGDLLPLFRSGQPLAILAGAGVSLDAPSRLLDGGTFMRDVLVWARPSEVGEDWAKALTVRPPGLSRPGEFLRFEVLMKALVDSGFDPALTVLNCLDECDRPNPNHYILAELLHQRSNGADDKFRPAD